MSCEYCSHYSDSPGGDLARICGGGAHVFELRDRFYSRSVPATSANLGFRRAPGQVQILPFDVQSGMRFAFSGEKLALFADNLFKNRHTKGSPDLLPLIDAQQLFDGMRQRDDCVAE